MIHINNVIHSPVMSDCYVDVFRTNLKVIKNQSNLLVRRCHEKVCTIRIAWIIARISWRIKFSTFARRTVISESTTAIGSRSARYLVFRFEGVPVGDITIIIILLI